MVSLSDDLDSYLADDPLYGGDPEPAADADRAEQSLHTLRWLRGKAQDISDLADRRTQLISEWAIGELDKLQTHIAWHEAVLSGWHQALLRENPKRKTIHLPSGTLKARDGRERIEIEDADAFVAFASTNAQDLLRIKYEADKKEIAKLITKDDGTIITHDGEVLPGVTKQRSDVSFTFDTNEVEA